MRRKGKIKVGTSLVDLPGYTKKLPATDGEERSLSQYRDESAVVLFFFPLAHSRHCTKEVCEFRDKFDQFQDVGAQVLGISSDSGDKLKQFAESQRAQYPLLSDAKGALRKELKVKGTLFGLLPGRETYVISKEGVVLLRFNDAIGWKKHVQQSLEVLQQQQQQP
ncbi:hypothetical protein WJX73_000931 [Symbiochloris irregularis]|uniref:thioredoxin-dependent peroxiredoxin n=1 Tax=Symbiochloris irregularis TaxID=706552 RepID=A0AAW1NVT1_9CHLO